MKVKSNDTVVVLTGKDKGKKGKVHSISKDGDRVIVSGVNIAKRHMKPRGMARQAGIIDKEASIHASNVAVVCSRCNGAARVGYSLLPDGTKNRICRKCGDTLS